MFNSKLPNLFEISTQKTKETSNSFINAGLQKSAETLSGNGALKYSTSGNPFVDQFNNLGVYREPRSFEKIAQDCELLWATDKELCVKFIFFIRMISRTIVNGKEKSSKSQKGGELKHEGIMRLIWLYTKNELTFFQNMSLIPFIGSWKDMFVMLRYDLIYNGWENRVLPWKDITDFIVWGLYDESQSELVKKYLPQIKAKSKCTTIESQANNIIGQYICAKVFGKTSDLKAKIHNHTQYRRLKSTGTAHEWQQLISKGKFNLIEFEKIHGRALRLLVKSKFLDNQNLREKYTEWITSDETTNVKFVGFVHELFEICSKYCTLSSMPIHERETINKQFDTLVNKCKDEGNTTGLIVVRDTSGSMSSDAIGTNTTSYNIAKAIALYFSAFLKGPFENTWIEFNSSAKMHEWKGDTPLEKWYNDASSSYGSTNFQSVIQLLCGIKQSFNILESEFPEGILCISDGEFNPCELNRTNVDNALVMLRRAGFSDEYINNFKIVLWDIPNTFYSYFSKSNPKFETFNEVPNVFYMSGYSAQIVSFLNGKIKTAYDLFLEAMDQEYLKKIKL